MQTPWYKEPWAYLVFGLPLISVFVGTTVFFVAQNNADTVVVDDYYKKGKSINQDIRKYKLAQKLGIRFDMQVTNNEIILIPTGIEKTFPVLNVNFYHVTMAERDFSVKLTPDGKGWMRQSFDQNVQGKWRVLVTPFDSEWKMQTTVALPQSQFTEFELQF
ncbi:FixH family protein [Thalassotalea nanhaiensis]|uniref:FixH family protein n=1 Tax=Thalassotalea nanhaiensis TaxID=3065648 RepID=A0ABY9TEL0_9GAMM|nr:FixH family protein [Colwelliaceae bacterium SQ345]